MSCSDRGMDAKMTCAWTALYTGKTTTKGSANISARTQRSLAIQSTGKGGPGKKHENFSMQFLESVHSRGKYSLSEREILRNSKASMNK